MQGYYPCIVFLKGIIVSSQAYWFIPSITGGLCLLSLVELAVHGGSWGIFNKNDISSR